VSKPIKPSDVGKAKAAQIPPAVFEAFNELIIAHWDGHAAEFTQAEAVALVVKKMPDTTKAQIYARHWLDVEAAYRADGWQVVYDKPGYNEDYEATFTFTKRRARRT
jgi:hypothetical protein